MSAASNHINHNTQAMADTSAIDQYGDVSNVSGAFKIGVKGRDAGAIVRRIVAVNVELFDGEKKATKAMPLHEIPLARLRIAKRTGSLLIDPIWAPGIPRIRGLTATAVKSEQDSLIERYTLMIDDAPFNCFHAIYGGVNNPCTFATRLSELAKAWDKMCQHVRQSRMKISVEHIEDVLRSVFPEDVLEPDFITAEDTSDIEQTGEISGSSVSIIPAAILEPELIKAGVPEETAKAYASIYEKLGGDPFSENEWSQIPGCEPGKRTGAKNRRELMRVTIDFLEREVIQAETAEDPQG